MILTPLNPTQHQFKSSTDTLPAMTAMPVTFVDGGVKDLLGADSAFCTSSPAVFCRADDTNTSNGHELFIATDCTISVTPNSNSHDWATATPVIKRIANNNVKAFYTFTDSRA